MKFCDVFYLCFPSNVFGSFYYFLAFVFSWRGIFSKHFAYVFVFSCKCVCAGLKCGSGVENCKGGCLASSEFLTIFFLVINGTELY